MTGREGVAVVVPEGFDAYARLLHPLHDGEHWDAHYLDTGTAAYRYPFPADVSFVEGDMGAALVDTLVPILAEATSTPESCHYALWSGWGELHRGSHTMIFWGTVPGETEEAARRQRQAEAPVFELVEACAVQPWWGGRDMLLFNGPVAAVAAIGTPLGDGLRRRGPQWWWPEDRAWFVGTEIDYPWTYLAGPAPLVDAVAGDPSVHAVRVLPSDRW